jgi:hypothetical protein
MLECALFKGCPHFLARPRYRVSTIAEEVFRPRARSRDFLTLPDILANDWTTEPDRRITVER